MDQATGGPACGCAPARHPRIRLLSHEQGATFASCGVVVLADTAELLRRFETDPEFRLTERARNLMTAAHHEYIHYLQAVGSVYLQQHGRQMLACAVRILRADPSDGAADADELVALDDELSRPGRSGLTSLDILESGAALGGFQMWLEQCGRPVDAASARAGFADELTRLRSGAFDRRYHAAFDWLERQIGLDLAYRLFAPLSFAAFNSADPPRSFELLAGRLARRRSRLAKALERATVHEVLDVLGMGDTWLEMRERVVGHDADTLTDVAFHLVDLYGIDGTLELLVRPWILDRDLASQAVKDSVAPLMLVWSTTDGLVTAQVSDLVDADLSRGAQALMHCAILGAAQRMIAVRAGQLAAYRPCQHTSCPFYAVALCHQYYFPPPLNRHHDTCDFVSTFHDAAGKSPTQA